MDRPFRPPPENGPDSPSSGDDVTNKVITDEPSPKKSKRGVHKRVVSVPIGDVDGSKSKGESFPPSDSWAWRKYGQKPIKGSPYPRGYYRCSSSKGCPARKQVERSRVDPTTLIITYACDHNHPIPAKSATSLPGTSAPATSAEEAAAKSSSAEEEEEGEDGEDEAVAAFSIGAGEGLIGGGGFEIGGEWFGDVVSMAVLESPICGDADADVAFSAVSGEDESLFADLGELPECAVVFRRRIEVPCCGSTG